MRTSLLAILFVFSASTWAQQAPAPKPDEKPISPLEIEGYIEPPEPLKSVLRSPRWENMSLGNLSPNRKWFAVTRQGGPVLLADLAKPHLNLGGEQVDPVADRSRNATMRGATGIEFVEARTNRRVKLQMPAGARLGGLEWSPTGSQVAFIGHFPNESRLMVANPETGAMRAVSTQRLLATEVESVQWSQDERTLYAVIVPPKRMAAPMSSAIPAQPRVQVSDTARNRARPVRNLMETKLDQDLYEYYTTGQLAKINVQSGKVETIAQPAMIRSFNVAPDGSAIRVSTTLKPFSYLVWASQFGTREALLDPTGKEITELSIRRLAFELGGGAAPGGPAPEQRRALAWRPDGKGFSFIRNAPRTTENQPNPGEADEQRPGGGQGRAGGGDGQPAGKQQIVQWHAPYGKDDIKVVYEHDGAIGGVQYSADCTKLFLSLTRSGKSETVLVDLNDKNKMTTLSSWTASDFYANPGSLMSAPTGIGTSAVMISSDNAVYFQGIQYDKDWQKNAPRPFIDKVSLADGKRERVWQSSDKVFESPVAVLDADLKQVVLNRQSPTDVPDNYLYQPADKSLTRLTANRDFAPDHTAAQRFTVWITRPDGFKFMAKVTMPKWWVKGASPLPAFFWFYPDELSTQQQYDESKRTENINTFPGFGSLTATLMVLMGYAVVEPDCPIIGPEGRRNDSYVPDLRNNLSATIDELSRQGFIDRTKLAIGGHSYGAFSTANALVHTPFFKAGIAGHGAYNRLLTPMQFQAETRLLWEARETYLTMSPLLYAEQMTGALLLYHGLDDNNPGTHPMNSERMFNALDGIGKTTSLYMYPFEDHSPAARETLLDIWARWAAWLDRHLKGAK